MSKHGSHILFHPQEYVIHPNDPSQDAMLGVDAAGTPLRVSLALNPAKTPEVDLMPSIRQFANSRGTNLLRCKATPDNTPLNPQGSLLLDQCFGLGLDDQNRPHFVAAWASVMRADAEATASELGIGYMEIDPQLNRLQGKDRKEAESLHNEVAQWHKQYSNTSPVDVENREGIKRQLVSYTKQLYDIRAPTHRAVILHPEGLTAFPADTPIDRIVDGCAMAMDELTGSGRYGGVIYRVRDNQGVIQAALSGKVANQYTQNGPTNGHLRLDSHLTREQGQHMLRALKSGYSVDILPFQHLNCGSAGNKWYKSSNQSFAMRQTYIDPGTQTAVAYPIALKVASVQKTGDQILGRIYAAGDPLGHPLLLRPSFENDQVTGVAFDENVKWPNQAPSVERYPTPSGTFEHSGDDLVAGKLYQVLDGAGLLHVAKAEKAEANTVVLKLNNLELSAETPHRAFENILYKHYSQESTAAAFTP